jgi:CRP-like cAMP-binding protein
MQRLIRRKSDFLLICSRYLWSVYQDVSLLASMSQTQDVRARFAHWLLLSVERCSPTALVITHAHIAQMLGVRRASITLVARELKMTGIIGYSRGMVEIKKPEVLRRLAHT